MSQNCIMGANGILVITVIIIFTITTILLHKTSAIICYECVGTVEYCAEIEVTTHCHENEQYCKYSLSTEGNKMVQKCAAVKECNINEGSDYPAEEDYGDEGNNNAKANDNDNEPAAEQTTQSYEDASFERIFGNSESGDNGDDSLRDGVITAAAAAASKNETNKKSLMTSSSELINSNSRRPHRRSLIITAFDRPSNARLMKPITDDDVMSTIFTLRKTSSSLAANSHQDCCEEDFCNCIDKQCNAGDTSSEVDDCADAHCRNNYNLPSTRSRNNAAVSSSPARNNFLTPTAAAPSSGASSSSHLNNKSKRRLLTTTAVLTASFVMLKISKNTPMFWF